MSERGYTVCYLEGRGYGPNQMGPVGKIYPYNLSHDFKQVEDLFFDNLAVAELSYVGISLGSYFVGTYLQDYPTSRAKAFVSVCNPFDVAYSIEFLKKENPLILNYFNLIYSKKFRQHSLLNDDNNNLTQEEKGKYIQKIESMKNNSKKESYIEIENENNIAVIKSPFNKMLIENTNKFELLYCTQLWEKFGLYAVQEGVSVEQWLEDKRFDKFERLEVPTLLINSRDDMIVGYNSAVEQKIRDHQYPNVLMVSTERGGHIGYYDNNLHHVWLDWVYEYINAINY